MHLVDELLFGIVFINGRISYVRLTKMYLHLNISIMNASIFLFYNVSKNYLFCFVFLDVETKSKNRNLKDLFCTKRTTFCFFFPCDYDPRRANKNRRWNTRDEYEQRCPQSALFACISQYSLWSTLLREHCLKKRKSK